MFQEDRNELQFDWCMIGDIEEGRPTLGPETSVAVYRMMQFSLRDVLIKEYGAESADRLFFAAGRKAGIELYRNNAADCETFDELVTKLQQLFLSLKLGIFRVEGANHQSGQYVFTVAEDLDCSGLPVSEETVCAFDEGLIAGILYAFTGKQFSVREIDCWCSGERICRFEVKMLK